VCDPSRKGRIAFRDAVKASIQDLDFVDFPVFKAGQTLRLNMVFGLTRQGKDVDNPLKFVMDALQGVLCRDVAIVWKSNVEKGPSRRDRNAPTFSLRRWSDRIDPHTNLAHDIMTD
jgi:hypothetical protein